MFDDSSAILQTFVFTIYVLDRRAVLGEPEERMIHVGADMMPNKEEMLEFAGDLLEAKDADDIEECWKKFGERWITHKADIHGAGRVEVRVVRKRSFA
jgi:hypothetical protein